MDNNLANENEKNDLRNGYEYMYTVLFIILMFILLVLCVMYGMDSKIPGTNYKGSCLLNLVTTYHTEGCLND
jgi:hypothetical protein